MWPVTSVQLTVSPEGTCKMDYIDPARLSQSRQQRQTGPEGAAVQGDVTLVSL